MTQIKTICLYDLYVRVFVHPIAQKLRNEQLAGVSEEPLFQKFQNRKIFTDSILQVGAWKQSRQSAIWQT